MEAFEAAYSAWCETAPPDQPNKDRCLHFWRAATERAAGIADSHCYTADNDVEEQIVQMAINIAAAIRAGWEGT